jgi:hypothetical protein
MPPGCQTTEWPNVDDQAVPEILGVVREHQELVEVMVASRAEVVITNRPALLRSQSAVRFPRALLPSGRGAMGHGPHDSGPQAA